MRRSGGFGRPLVTVLVTYVVYVEGGPDVATTMATLLTTPGSKPSSMINAVLLGVAVALLIATLGSLGGMIFCLAKFKKSKPGAKGGAPAKKGLLGAVGKGKTPVGAPGAAGKPGAKLPPAKPTTSSTSLKKPGGPLKPTPTVPPTKITVGGKKPAQKSKQAPKQKTATPTTSTTRSSSQPKRGPPSPQGHKESSQKDLPPEPTQQSSHRSVRLEIEDPGAAPPVIRKTFISFGNEPWREAEDTSAETEDFSFEIASGNTFSLLDE